MYSEEVPYIEGNPPRTELERRGYWECAKGLQLVDGLSVSSYAEQVSEEYVSGTMTSSDFEATVDFYHRSTHEGDEPGTREADLVSTRMVAMLEGNGFVFSPATLKAIHRRLFDGVFERKDWVGRYRSVNLSKEEPVLGGNSVTYADHSMIVDTLEYDFAKEASRRRERPAIGEDIETFADFIGCIWQVHPFREGNTRTTALFAQMYLQSLGCRVSNDVFADNSVFFRDALVRASFSSVRLGIAAEPRYLRLFFENVILGRRHDLGALDLNLHGIRRSSEMPYRTTNPRRAGMR